MWHFQSIRKYKSRLYHPTNCILYKVVKYHAYVICIFNRFQAEPGNFPCYKTWQEFLTIIVIKWEINFVDFLIIFFWVNTPRCFVRTIHNSVQGFYCFTVYQLEIGVAMDDIALKKDQMHSGWWGLPGETISA